MLIEKKPAHGEVVTIRLVSGEEVIGRLQASDPNTTKLQKPIVVALQMLPNNQASIAFMPLLASTDESSSVVFPNASIVILPMFSRKDVADQYIRSTTDLEIPPSGLLLP